jgi:hypothetical protein
MATGLNQQRHLHLVRGHDNSDLRVSRYPHPMADELRLDEATQRMLAKLAVVAHTTPQDYLAQLIADAHDRQFPAGRKPGERPQVDPAWPRHEIREDPAAERHLDELLAQAERDADRIYGKRHNKAA